MILAHMAAQYPEELTCDMAETYHVLDWRALGLPLAATAAVDENQGRPAWPEPPRAPCAHPVGAGAGV